MNTPWTNDSPPNIFNQCLTTSKQNVLSIFIFIALLLKSYMRYLQFGDGEIKAKSLPQIFNILTIHHKDLFDQGSPADHFPNMYWPNYK